MKGKRALSLTALLLAVLTLLLLADSARAQSEDKRGGPSGFMGMRGKKDEGGTEGESGLDKRAPSGFMGMRGKKEGLEGSFVPYSAGQDYVLAGDKSTSPNSGFYEMRGKKAPSGFLGMRGKKESETSDEDSDDGDGKEGDYSTMWQPGSVQDDADAWDGYLTEESKRARSGFMGMRGKKKTAAGYYRYRGKKAPSGFMGMRGKKSPSGFMGMRGKKDEDDNETGHSFDDIDSLLSFLINANAEAYQRNLLNTDMHIPQKKGPSGFLGMRGKRWIPQGASSFVTTDVTNPEPQRKSDSSSLSSSHL